MDFKTAWNIYQAHYSPSDVFGDAYLNLSKTPQKFPDLLAIKDEFDALLLDGFGVLNVGESVIADMPRIINTLKDMGKHIFVLTNGGSRASVVIAKKYPSLGYNIDPEYVISSRDALEIYLKDHPITRKNGLWGAIVMPNSQLDMLPASAIYLDNDQDFDKVDGFLFLGSFTWNNKRQAALAESLMKNPRPVLIGNPDICAPLEDGLSTEPGFYALLLEAIDGVELTRFGKPFPNIYAHALDKMAKVLAAQQKPMPDKQRILMVGDTLHTDILGGNGAGMKTALMTDWGFLRGQDATLFIHESQITPDFILGV